MKQFINNVRGAISDWWNDYGYTLMIIGAVLLGIYMWLFGEHPIE